MRRWKWPLMEIMGMADIKTINVYCDESCHLERDRIPVMVWGAVLCEKQFVPGLSERIRAIKVEHGFKSDFEVKWTKASPARADFYLALTDFFLADERLRFRGLVVPDKRQLDHARFDQSHHDWYYKMYFTMLRPVFMASQRYRIYLDVKDTRGGPKTRELQDVLANSLHDFSRECIERVQQIRSHESELLPLADLLIGALAYANRGLTGNQAKTAIIARLHERLGEQALTCTSPIAAAKFNILFWRPQKAGG